MAGAGCGIDRRIAIGFAQFNAGLAFLNQGALCSVAFPAILSPSGFEAKSALRLRWESALRRCCERSAAAYGGRANRKYALLKTLRFG